MSRLMGTGVVFLLFLLGRAGREAEVPFAAY